MQFYAIFLLGTALTVAATPVTTFKPKMSVPRVKTPNVKNVSVKLDLDQCEACFSSIGSTIGACEPVFQGDFFSSFSCVSQVVKDFTVLVGHVHMFLRSLANV